AENVAQKYKISREAQDEFAFKSHHKAVKAVTSGRFKDEIIPLKTSLSHMQNGRPVQQEFSFDTDEGPRSDTSTQALAKLKPAFSPKGTVTAGNASQMSDGASAALVMSEARLKGLNLNPMARIAGYAVAGVPPEIMGIGPVEAIPKALKNAGLQLSDIGLIELNEAFASQALACINELDLDPDIVNVNGGAIALGHPLGCTGGKLTASLLHEMKRREVRYGICSMCIGGGMGAAAVFELL
ncbi:MAG: thiolase family protein, partial [Cyclonatronaceae bacterium]